MLESSPEDDPRALGAWAPREEEEEEWAAVKVFGRGIGHGEI